MTPLLTGERADRAHALVADIAAALRDPAVYDADPGLAGSNVGRGSAGAALFFAELAAVTGDDKDAETALAFLDTALDRAAEEMPTALLFPGTVGVGWTLAYLEGGLLDPSDEPNDADELVLTTLRAADWPSVDLIRGIAGTAVYLLERLPHPNARTGLDLVVARLTELAEQQPAGATWFVPPELLADDRKAAYPNGYWDVGVAHGQAGVVGVLAAMVAAGVDARSLLAQATGWLLAQRLPDGVGPGHFPAIVGKDQPPPEGCRLAWCYGDIGVATALLAAGRALGDERVVDEAVSLALRSAERSRASSGVTDAPLCHGSVGLMHAFGRLAETTGERRLADAATEWFDVALAQRRSGHAVAGWGSWRAADDGTLEYEPLAGFLEGATGVGLALLAATSEWVPGWDALLLTKPVA